MHPIVSELFAKPVGWMTLGGLGFIVFLGGYLWWFARRRIREEMRQQAGAQTPRD